jgi:cyclopentanol dehydrogenase
LHPHRRLGLPLGRHAARGRGAVVGILGGDTLFVCAGEETTEEEWDLIFRINAKGVFLGTKAAVPALVREGGGSIVNISSIYGIIGAPSAAAYEASKGAVRLLTKASAVDLAKYGIRVNSVHPGVIATPMTTGLLATPESTKAVLSTTILDRPGQPEEVSNVVLFLASDEASFVTL